MNRNTVVKLVENTLHTEWNYLEFAKKCAIAEMVTEYTTVGRKMVDIALTYLLTKKELGKILEVNGSTVCSWELGEF